MDGSKYDIAGFDFKALNAIFNEQEALMVETGFWETFGADNKGTETMVIAALVGEATEMLDHFTVGLRPWKDQEIDDGEVLEESIDVLHYLVEYWIMKGISPSDVLEAYMKKNAYNRGRVAEKLAAQAEG